MKISLGGFVDLLQHDIPPVQYNCFPGYYAKLSVQDNGCGISEEMLNKIFDPPFYTTKEEHEGAGMGGLSTVQGVVAQHGGIIKVNSVIGRGGTIFDLYFPIIDEAPVSAPAPENTTLPEGQNTFSLLTMMGCW